MKRIYALLLVIVVLMAGCSSQADESDISVKDVCCPYEICSDDDALEITLRDGEKNGIAWVVQTVPEDVCSVTEKSSGKEFLSRYHIVGTEEGAAQVTFTAMQKDETVRFVLTLVIHVNAEKKAKLTSYEHRERDEISVEEGSLNYKWNVDVDGVLNFSFINAEDLWSVRSESDDVCALMNKLSTPSGCKFSAQALSTGQSVVMLLGEATHRTIYVTIQADDNGNLAVISVQER